MTFLHVINQSTLVTDAECKAMIRACATQLRHHASPVWGKYPASVSFQDDLKATQPGAYVLFLADDTDQAGALGYHTEGQGDPDQDPTQDQVWGIVAAKPGFDNGSTAFTGDYPTSTTLSHEVLEAFVNPNVQTLAQDYAESGFVAYPLEVCDAVEADYYTIRDAHSGVDVPVSNFVFPAYFDAMSHPGEKFDYLGKVTRPFAIRPGGYSVKITTQGESQVFGRDVPGWRRALKDRPLARNARYRRA